MPTVNACARTRRWCRRVGGRSRCWRALPSMALVVRVDPATETGCFGQPEVVAFLQINDDIANRL